jgi:hypothetical protein
MKNLLIVAWCALALTALPAPAQDKVMDEMRAMAQSVKEDRKAFVAAKLPLTDREAEGFWPVYDAYQRDLMKINERLYRAIEAYAKAYKSDSLTDAQAASLLDEFLAIEEAEVKLKKSYVPRLSKVLPARKVAIYVQIENKIRAQVRHELAVAIPLAR